MIARTWHARLSPGREADYDAFAGTRSLPMFRRLPGCRGVLFLGEGLDRRVLSLWTAPGAIDALTGNADYLAVSRQLAESGILASVGPIDCTLVDDATIVAGAIVRFDDALALAHDAALELLGTLNDRPACPLK